MAGTTRKPAITALKAFVACDWAVDPDWAEFAKRFLLTGERGEIPERDGQDAALLSRTGSRIDGTRYAYREGRTAVFDVYGAIVPRANLFSEWSGGTSCELLARDVALAADSEEIDDLLFVIHSPGGEVTGVSELAALIRGITKPKRAYISGMGCSAAYWLASACDSITVADTALVGSIGVMAVYVDDSKALEDAGYERLTFVSSQSPRKNRDPKSAGGRADVQKRIDALAAVFVETVARNRNTDVATVLAKFGQGGVLVGTEAVKAGLVDRVGSYAAMFAGNDEEDCGPDPEEIDPEEAPDDAEPADGAEQDSVLAADKSKTGEIQMANTDKQPQADQATATVDAAELEAMKARLQALEASDEAQKATIAGLKAERQTAELTELAKGFHGETAKHVSVMTGLANAFGRDSQEFADYVAVQKALTEQLDKATLFEAAGSDAGGENQSALETLNALAKTRASERGIEFSNAFAEVALENQSLYAQYQAENGGR